MAKKAGQPTSYTKALADDICAQLVQGVSLRKVCRDEKMPCAATVFNWLRTYPEFLEQYARAKEESSDAMAEDLLDIADDGTNDYVEKETQDGVTYTVINNENIQRSRLRVDSRKWLMSKMKPKKYGDRIDHTSGGEALKAPQILIFSADDPLKKHLDSPQ